MQIIKLKTERVLLKCFPLMNKQKHKGKQKALGQKN